MQEGRPSLTAFGVARRRAAHQILDRTPLVLSDPVAVPILGANVTAEITNNLDKHDSPFARGMRAFMVARSRYAEDQLHDVITRGIHQYVVLGAGLDTFAYRSPYSHEQLQIFEVDHPATQQWKRGLLIAAGIPIPSALTFVPIDFEQQTLATGLVHTGFRFDRPAFFSWLGVTPYLTLAAFRATVGTIGGMPSGSAVTFEYALPRSLLNEQEKLGFDRLAERVAAAGEPFQLSFSPEQMKEELKTAGFQHTEELTSDDINNRYFHDRSDGLRLYGGVARLVTAWT
jgi:methyltransferase (TIGR00027 family)